MSRDVTNSRGHAHSEFCILNSEFGGPRPGYTMAELMIVVIIMLMLVAAALPVAKKVMDDSHVREASRQLNAYLAMAKARAVQTGRPCGIQFDAPTVLGINHVPTLTWPVRHVTQMHLAEVPTPYSGADINSRASVVNSSGLYFTPEQAYEFQILSSLLNPGESFQVRFDYRGAWHIFLFDQTATNQAQFFPYDVNANLNAGNAAPPLNRALPYQIRRSPRKVGNPLAMPNGTCIDLTYSGVGPSVMGYNMGGLAAASLQNMTVMFTPGGGVDSLYFNGRPGAIPNNTLFFLVGKVDKAVDDPTTASFADIRDSNLADPTSLWVTVGRGNGQVTTSENTPDPTIVTASGIPPGQRLQYYLRAARSVATSREQMKGR